MATIQCRKCNAAGAPPDFVPYPGDLGALITNNVCNHCWEEWKKMSVMVINEYRLTTFLPEHRQILVQQMKEFLNLS